MLAVVPSSVAQAPAELQATQTGDSSGQEALRTFQEANEEGVAIQFANGTALCYSHEKELLSCPRQFASADDIFCIFTGNLENLPQLRQIYGLGKNISEVQLVLESYKVLRDRGPYSADQVLGDLRGSFTFIIYDHHCKTMFIAADRESKVPLFWGVCEDGSLVVSNTNSILKAGCGKSFAPFPRGCYFWSKTGLKDYRNPKMQLKPFPHIDSQGQLCGSNFKVEEQIASATKPELKWMRSF